MALTKTQKVALKALKSTLSADAGATRVHASMVEGTLNAALNYSVPWVKIRWSTWAALEKNGLVSINRISGSSQRLRRGAYGRWIGGTVTDYYVDLWISLTPLGAQAEI